MSKDERSKRDRDFLDSAFQKYLTERERKVLTLYHGIEGGGKRTPEEIGSLLGVTRERIRQELTHATDKLLADAEGAQVSDLFDDWGLIYRAGDELEPLKSVPPVAVLIDPGLSSSADLAALYVAISAVNRAHGGEGIAFRQEATEVGFVAGAV